MNWRRGTFRLVVIASVLWAAGVGWISYRELVVRPAAVESLTEACFKQRTVNPSLGNPFGCFDPYEEPTRLWPFVRLLILPILAAFVARLVMIWAFDGFRSC